MLDVSCPQCGLTYHSEETHVGRQIRCTRCGSLVPILGADHRIAESKAVSPTASAKAVPRKTRQTLHPAYTIAGALVILSALALIAREIQSHTAELVTPASEHDLADRTSGRTSEPDTRRTEF